MNVVCPNYVTVNSWLKEGGLSVSNPTLNENMWLVDKQGYDKCAVNEKGDPNFNKLFLLCNKPQGIKYKSLIFDENFNDVEPKFSPGQHYYFICEYQIRNVLIHLGILIGKVFRLLCYLYTYLFYHIEHHGCTDPLQQVIPNSGWSRSLRDMVLESLQHRQTAGTRFYTSCNDPSIFLNVAQDSNLNATRLPMNQQCTQALYHLRFSSICLCKKIARDNT